MRKSIIATVIIILIASNFIFSYNQRAPSTLVCCDEFEYHAIAKNMADGHGYSIQTKTPFTPTLMREPGYPLLLALTLRINAQHGLLLAQIINIILILASSLILWKISRRVISPRLAMLPSILFLISPRVSYYSFTVLSDVMAVFLLILAIELTLWSYEKEKNTGYLITGMSFGLLVLAKMSFLLLLPFLILLISVFDHIKKDRAILSFSRSILKILRFKTFLMLLGFFIVLAPWLGRNIIIFGQPALTVRTGQLLFERTRLYENKTSLSDFIKIPVGDIFPLFRTKLAAFSEKSSQEKDITSPYGINYGPPDKNAPSRFFSLIKNGLSETVADRLMIKIAIQKIILHPSFYIAQIPFEAIKFFYPEFIPGLFINLQNYSAPAIQIITASIILLSVAFLLLVWRGAWHLAKQSNIASIILLAAALYASAVHILLYVTPRYSFIIYPPLLILLTNGLGNNLLRSGFAAILKKLTPFFLAAIGGLNLFFHFTLPVIKWISNIISDNPTCVSCTEKHFFILDLTFSSILILTGVFWLSYQRYSASISQFITARYVKIIKLLIFFSLCLIALSSFNRLIAIDEIEHIHSTWHIFNGQLPYVDFFEQHHPFLWYTLAPLLNLTGATIKAIFVFRIVMLSFTFGSFYIIYKLAKTIFSRDTALIAVLFITNFILFLDPMIEIRPDVPQTFFALAGILFFVLFVKKRELSRLLAGAFALGIAFLFLQKIIYLAIAIGLMLIYEALKQRAQIKSVIIYITGFLMPIIPYYCYIFWSQALPSYLANNWLVNFFLTGRSSPFANLSLSLLENTLIWTLGIYGLFLLVKSKENIYRIFAVLTLLNFVLVFLFKFPAKQYFSIFFALLVIAAAYGFNSMNSALNFNKTRQLFFVLIIIAIPVFFLIENAVPNNREHLQKIKYILDLTNKEDSVADPSVTLNIFRKDLGYFWYATQPILQSYARFSPREYDLCGLIKEKKPKIIIEHPLISRCESIRSYSPTRYPEIFLSN